ncbi:MAG TPA: hypothetical protein VFH37_00740 [Candidatus Saccharimonadales bacterium]|nr:hypothetical protein [Candidatus Saccharimonadales bacterium]
MAIINRNRATDPNLDQIAWAEHAHEDFEIQKGDGVEKPILSQALVEEASVIGGIPHELLATMGLKLASRRWGEYWFMENNNRNGGGRG